MSEFNYETLDTVIDPELHLSGIITFRLGRTGERLYSFSLGRDYETPTGTKGKTSWFHRRHIAALHRLLDEIEKRMVMDEGWNGKGQV